MHDKRVEVVGQTARRGGVAGLFELVDQHLQALRAVARVDRQIQRVPLGLADAFAFTGRAASLCNATASLHADESLGNVVQSDDRAAVLARCSSRSMHL
jgi:hypothetical protein